MPELTNQASKGSASAQLIAVKKSIVSNKLNLTAMEQPIWNFEQYPSSEPLDETGVNLRAYFDRMDDEKMRQYSHDWIDEQIIEWDGNFRDDGNLMLLCCERDVDVAEYRQVLESCIDYRNRVRNDLLQKANA